MWYFNETQIDNITIIKKGQDKNPAPFKIQYPMKNRYKTNRIHPLVQYPKKGIFSKIKSPLQKRAFIN